MKVVFQPSLLKGELFVSGSVSNGCLNGPRFGSWAPWMARRNYASVHRSRWEDWWDESIPWMWPPSQDAGSWPPGWHYIFRLGDPYKASFTSFTTVTVRGPHPKYTHLKFNKYAPEKLPKPNRRGKRLPSSIFQGRTVKLRGCIIIGMVISYKLCYVYFLYIFNISYDMCLCRMSCWCILAFSRSMWKCIVLLIYSYIWYKYI